MWKISQHHNKHIFAPLLWPQDKPKGRWERLGEKPCFIIDVSFGWCEGARACLARLAPSLHQASSKLNHGQQQPFASETSRFNRTCTSSIQIISNCLCSFALMSWLWRPQIWCSCLYRLEAGCLIKSCNSMQHSSKSEHGGQCLPADPLSPQLVCSIQIPTLVVAICVGNVYYMGESKLGGS